ncbi:MAG: hypothetical protein JKX69_12430 [Rhodobacteraceae bacterium]|nr:hypothetical protein [Paracoccaceae bacterium]PHQ71239.1 MAG: hypothetical protein COB93_03615 [Sneathiella sp.]
MADNFRHFTQSLNAPASTHRAVTPDDNNDLDPIPRAIFCAADGTAVIVDRLGNQLSYTLTSGQVLPFRAHRVMATGTSATLIAWE